jgi:hypothetical protein
LVLGAAPVAVALGAAHSADACVAIACCSALADLAVFGDDDDEKGGGGDSNGRLDGASAVVDAGGVGIAVRAVRMHAADAACAAQACGLLERLCSCACGDGNGNAASVRNSRLSRALVDGGAPAALAAALRAHPHARDIAESACCALERLWALAGASESCESAVLAAGAVPAVAAALRAHGVLSLPGRGLDGASIAGKGTWFLRGLARDGSAAARAALVAADAAGAVDAVARVHRGFQATRVELVKLLQC